jgi:hypothetical protein
MSDQQKLARIQFFLVVFFCRVEDWSVPLKWIELAPLCDDFEQQVKVPGQTLFSLSRRYAYPNQGPTPMCSSCEWKGPCSSVFSTQKIENRHLHFSWIFVLDASLSLLLVLSLSFSQLSEKLLLVCSVQTAASSSVFFRSVQFTC